MRSSIATTHLAHRLQAPRVISRQRRGLLHIGCTFMSTLETEQRRHAPMDEGLAVGPSPTLRQLATHSTTQRKIAHPHHHRLTSGPLPLPHGGLRHERRPGAEAPLQPLRALLGERERRQEAQQLRDGVRRTPPGPAPARGVGGNAYIRDSFGRRRVGAAGTRKNARLGATQGRGTAGIWR